MASTSEIATTNNSTPVVDNEKSGVSEAKNIIVTKSAILIIANFVLWVLTLVLLLIALIILCTNSNTIGYSSITDEELVLHFQDVYAYRYMLSVIVIGIAYTLLRFGLLIYQIIIPSKANILFDFYGDKIVSYFLATGAAAGFGVTKDMNEYFDEIYGSEIFDEFCSKGYASASLLLLAFLCTASSSVMSSYALTKRV